MEKLTDTSLHNFIKVIEIAGILKRTPRTGWVDVGVYEPESVADHTFRTAFLCILYADMNGLDSLKLLRMALIHDLPEAIIGDLMPSQKNSETKESEENAIHKVLGLLPQVQRENYLALWNEYQEGKTKEAQALQQIDKIEMALQAKEYERFGSAGKSLERFMISAQDVVVWPELKQLLSCILEEK
jgi:putative hydrolase of HD superfamily